ncbi:hypothetical protein [Cryptosporangium phraense]|uniref:Uncharacterized protein n=1 Tax=Cryptosporangium phraense TaxID=2593070 RepID=A0A545AZX9_9ACTN|nr:hypothetical protein [Cryptosporangium phraense]TQS46864.1 hypothetical protein FL583_00875 [Cryptosporangium phraense]
MLETARLEADPSVRILASWVDPGRYECGALCVLFVQHGPTRDLVLGLDWDLTRDPDGLGRTSMTAERMGMDVFYSHVQEPPGRALQWARHRGGVAWSTAADEPPAIPDEHRLSVRMAEGRA